MARTWQLPATLDQVIHYVMSFDVVDWLFWDKFYFPFLRKWNGKFMTLVLSSDPIHSPHTTKSPPLSGWQLHPILTKIPKFEVITFCVLDLERVTANVP